MCRLSLIARFRAIPPLVINHSCAAVVVVGGFVIFTDSDDGDERHSVARDSGNHNTIIHVPPHVCTAYAEKEQTQNSVYELMMFMCETIDAPPSSRYVTYGVVVVISA